MEKLPLNIFDLVPKETEFTLSTYPDKKFTLCRWSLRVRSWAIEKYTSEGLKMIFEKQMIDQVADLAYYMLKEKEFFGNNRDNFLDAISSVRDQYNLYLALLGAVGIGEPEVKQITDAMEKHTGTKEQGETPSPKNQSAKRKTGAKSSTP